MTTGLGIVLNVQNAPNRTNHWLVHCTCNSTVEVVKADPSFLGVPLVRNHRLTPAVSGF